MRGEFSQRQTRCGVHRKISDFFAQGGETAEPMHEKRGLTVLGLSEFLLRASESNPAERGTHHRVATFKKFPDHRVFRGEVAAHADGLRALAREQQRDTLFHKSCP